MAAWVNVEGSSFVLSVNIKHNLLIRYIHVYELKMHALAELLGKELVFSLFIPVAQLHCLSCSRSLVQQGCVGNGHACDVTDHGLVVEERLQATLGNFRLVGCVLSHPEDKRGTTKTTK